MKKKIEEKKALQNGDIVWVTTDLHLIRATKYLHLLAVLACIQQILPANIPSTFLSVMLSFFPSFPTWNIEANIKAYGHEPLRYL